MCGSGTVEPKMETDRGQEVIYKLCQGSLSVNEVPDDILDSFEKIGALRIENNKCYLNFTCFLQKDVDILNAKCDILGKALAKKISTSLVLKDGLEFTFDEVDLEKYLFFLVGCVCLDWHGLEILRNLGLILGHNQIKKPGYGHFSLVGHEHPLQNVKELYYESHNSTYGQYCFTTFGAPDQERKAFPDLNWKFKEGAFDMNRISKLFIGRQFENNDTTQLLKELKYIKNGKVNIPIITLEDTDAVSPLVKKTDEIIRVWVKENSGDFKRAFSGLTPVKFGVDFKDVLIQVWHYIFGHTNKHLSRMGFFLNPYSDKSDFKGYLPVMHDSSCNLEEIKGLTPKQ